jgi:Uma2 family endonuclease
MNLQPDLRMDKAAFLSWIETKEERHELAGGRVVKLPRPTWAHARIKSNLIFMLHSRLDRRQWEPLFSFGLDVGPETFRYPDFVVDRAGGSGRDFAARAPVVLIEVLSPEDAEIDLGDKVAEYLQIPTLIAYIVLSQDEPKAWVWSRMSTSAHFTSEPEGISGAGAVIAVSGLPLELPMTDIYEGTRVG